MVFGSWPVFWFVKVQKGTFKYLDIKVCIDVLVYIEHMYTYVYIKSHVVIYMCLILVHIILITSERFKW